MSIVELRKLIGAQLGLSNFDGSNAAWGNLPTYQQDQVAAGVANYILTHQTEYSATQIQAAKNALSIASTPVQTYDLFDKLGDFSSAYVETLGDTGGAVLGAVSDATGLKTAVTIAAVVAVLYFGAPYVLPKLRKSLAK